jgi:type IV pilus assembly protein PilO
MADTNPSRLPLGAQLGIALGLAAVLVGAFYFLIFSDMLAEEEQKTQQLKTLTEQIRALEVTAAKLSEFQREVAQLEARLEMLKRVLPPEKETPDLVRKLNNLASESNLRIKQFNPGAMIPRDFYQEFPINIEVDGSYHNLALFFDRVSRLSRLVNAGGLKIVAKKDQTPLSTITANCVATTFVYSETAAAAAAPPAQAGKRAGKGGR